jgi:hypothetical protein
MPKHSLFRSFAFAAAVAVANSPTVTSQTPRDGAAVLEGMRAAYAGKWYNTLTFVQKTTAARRDGTTNVSTWRESLRYTPPDGVRLRIDVGDLTAGNGMLYTADSTWSVRNGTLQGARGSGNEFLPLALDGYEPVGPAWLATKIVMAINGKVIQTEEYSDWKTGVELPASLFDVKTWTTAPHWAKK